METKYYVIIKVLDVARFYRDVLGYSVQVWKHDKDITAVLDTGKTVVVKKFD